MPLHKSARAHRLDPTMISAPLGDFRHTMHIGRGGDAFGDTSFLSSHGPSKADSFKSVASPVETPIDSKEVTLNHDLESNTPDEQVPQLQHSESVSSFDLDLDLGPSILGDVLGVMDGLSMGSEWTTGTEGDEEVFTLNKSKARAEVTSMDMAPKQNDRIENFDRVEEQHNDINGIKSKGLRPKVRFSDKKEEIVGRPFVADGSEEERENGMYTSPAEDVQFRAEGIAKESELPEFTNHCEQHSPSPSSSASSEYEGISPLDRRREEDQLSEESEEEGISAEQGYTFDDESDDEIGL